MSLGRTTNRTCCVGRFRWTAAKQRGIIWTEKVEEDHILLLIEFTKSLELINAMEGLCQIEGQYYHVMHVMYIFMLYNSLGGNKINAIWTFIIIPCFSLFQFDQC